MRNLIVCLVAIGLAGTAAPAELFNGKDLTGWELVATPATDLAAVCHVNAEGVLAVAGKPIGYLATTDTFQKYRLQLQTKEGRAGDLLPMAGAKFAETLSTAPDAKTPQLDRIGLNSEKPVGEWNSVDIVCRGDTIVCSINGVRQNRVTKCTPQTGKVGVQLEGFPFELRNIRLTPLGR